MTNTGAVKAQLQELTKEVTQLKKQRAALRDQQAVNGLAIAYAKRENTQPQATKELKQTTNERLRTTVEAKDAYLDLLKKRNEVSLNVPLPKPTIEKRLHQLFKSLTRNVGPSTAHTLEAEQRLVAEFFEFQELHRRVELLDLANHALTQQRTVLQSSVATLNKEQRQTRREEQRVQRALDAVLGNARTLRKNIGRQHRNRTPSVSVESSELLMNKFRSGDALNLDEIQAMLEHSSLFQDPNPTEMTDDALEA